MKRKWHHPEAQNAAKTLDRDYWRSYDELEDTQEFRDWLEKEFPRGAQEMVGEEADEETRRGFLKYMGASTALAGLGMASCRRNDLYLVPFNEHVENQIPGKAMMYSTAIATADGAIPLVATTYEGRPTKVDGNKLHPQQNGGTDAFTQASILDLYDPDRSKNYLYQGKKSTAEDFENGFLAGFRESKGQKAALLLGASSSPTRARVLEKISKTLPQLQVFEYEPLLNEAKKEADAAVWGEGISAVPQFDKAERILSLDADFMGLDPMGEDASAQWAAGRKPEGKMNRLYVVEPAFTVTGGAADHRLRIPSSQVLKVTALIAKELGVNSPLLGKFRPEVFNADWIKEAAADLKSAQGKALVVAGSRQPKAVHVLVAQINQALGAIGANKPLKTVNHGRKSFPGLSKLVEAIGSGAVETVISMTPADPVFDAPTDLKVGEAFGKLKNLVTAGVRVTATAQKAAWHVPGAHYLESWGDAQSATGVYSVTQPMILPLFNGVSELEFLLSLLPPVEAAEGEEVSSASLDAVRETFKGIASGDVDKAWNLTLRDGFLKDSKLPDGPAAAKADAAALNDAVIADHPYEEALEVNLVPSSHVYDGRYINNSWMLEAPDPITKLTWDNAALVSKKTAERILGKGNDHDGRMIKVIVGENSVTVPIFKVPGIADFSIQLPVGWGQENVGRCGSNTGFNVWGLSTSANRYTATATVENANDKYELAPTAIHWSMQGRAIVREGTKEMYDADHEFAQDDGMDSHIPPNISLYQGPDYTKTNAEQPYVGAPLQRSEGGFRVDENHQWAMTIDLNSCLGCNACTIACQAENNIPVVGKEQVIRGREMHWIRMDRYFSSPKEKTPTDPGMTSQKTLTPDGRGRPAHDDDNVEMLTQPVACVQCENAPCETVCPVNATTHTDDGLNSMVYNRCIGTRYCANNCPYKARRFNYFDYNKRRTEDFYLGPLAPAAGLGTTSLKLQKNPNVTVRMRGVIEKCTYCVQSIQAAKIAAKAKAGASKDVQVPTGAVKTACQSVCGTGAITFGNLKDPKDPINTTKKDPRNYDLLKYIGTLPRTSYLAKVRNPNPKMPGAEHVGQATAHMH